MKVLYFDCFSGISGDMTLGALIDLGVDVEYLKCELKKLNVEGFELKVEKKVSSGITVTDVDVIITEQFRELESSAHQHLQEHVHHDEVQNGDLDHDHGHDLDQCHDHGYNHHHKEDGQIHQHSEDVHDHEHNEDGHSHHGHSHHQKHNHDHSHEHTVRNLKDIEKILDLSDLNQNVKGFSKKVFKEIAAAEAKVHNKDINEVHFHEVGALDSIVDIVGTAICLDALGVDKVYSSALHEGSGFITCQHGILPVPVPAVMEMLSGSGIPIIQEDINTELVTPTGLGLIKSIAQSYGKMPQMSIVMTGYGKGKRETGRFNALRVVLGEIKEEIKEEEFLTTSDEIIILETNIDDMSPEAIAYAAEKLMSSGALDVFFTPIYMKKGRPAQMMTVLTSTVSENGLLEIILSETTTIGVRRSSTQRYCMNREIISVKTQFGEVRVKKSWSRDIVKYAPEYDDCRQIAVRTGIPLQDVFDEAKYNASKPKPNGVIRNV